MPTPTYYVICRAPVPAVLKEGDGVEIAEVRARAIDARYLRKSARAQLERACPERRGVVKLQGRGDAVVMRGALSLAEAVRGVVTYPSFELIADFEDSAVSMDDPVAHMKEVLIETLASYDEQARRDAEERKARKRRLEEAAREARRSGDAANDWSDILNDD